MKRLLLTRTYKKLASGGPVPPMGLLYISAVIHQHLPGQFEILLWDTGVKGEDVVLFERCLEDFKPDLVGFSTLTPEHDLLLSLSAVVRRNCPEAFVFAGGAHVTAFREKILECQDIDAFVIGEGEGTVVDLLRVLGEKGDIKSVKGLLSRSDSGQYQYLDRPVLENLDQLPFPDWSLIDPADYSGLPNWNGPSRRKTYMPLVTSRGCPYPCTFCHAIFGKKFRSRSADNVWQEIEVLYQRGIREFHIVDDIFNLDLQRAKAICRLIIGSGKDVFLAFPNGLRADIMDEELVLLLKKAGTYKIHFAIESGSERIRRSAGKDIDLEKSMAIIRKASAAGILTGGYFMMGFPTETREELLATIRVAVDSPLHIAYFFKVTPYAGTVLRAGLSAPIQEDHSRLHFFDAGFSHADVSSDELNSLIMLAQQKFFLKPGRIARLLILSPCKRRVCGDLLRMFALMCCGYLLRHLKERP